MTAAFGFVLLQFPNRMRPKIGRRPYPSLDKYLAYAAKEAQAAGVSLEAILGHSRDPAHCVPRFKVWRALQKDGCCLPGIGKRAGGRHHTTILSGIRRLAEIEAGEASGTVKKPARKPQRSPKPKLIPYAGYEERA